MEKVEKFDLKDDDKDRERDKDKDRKEDRWYPEAIVLGPGGMKGFLELGALIGLDERGYLKEVHTYVGCSVGAIIGLLLVAGYKPIDIVNDAMNTNIFKDILYIELKDLQKKKENVGLLSSQELRTILTSKLKEKFGMIPTLRQLYMATGLTLITVALNLDKDEMEYLSWKTEPDLSCIEATLLSMNIPFIFYKIKYKSHIYIDGAFGNPYPVDIVDDGKTRVLGISITTKHPYIYDSTDDDNLRYVYKVINASMTQIKKRIEKSCSPACKHLTLYSPSMDTTGLTFDTNVKVSLLMLGYNTAKQFVDNLLHPPISMSEAVDEISFTYE